jgi:hypothetical protein
MNTTKATLILSAALLSLFWNIGNNYGLVIIFLIRPLILGAAFASLWKTKKRMKRIILSLAGVMFCISLSSVAYGAQTEWWYVLEDLETQSVLMMIGIWTAVLSVISSELILVIKRRAEPIAGGDAAR